MKTTLKVETSVGQFTRTTATAYTHAVVRTCAAATRALEGNYKGGVYGRWAKDRGYAVTWHGSAAAAAKAAATPYVWDLKAVVVGVFAVQS